MLFFFFNDTATTEIYTLSLHDALPIFSARLCHYLARDHLGWQRPERPPYLPEPFARERDRKSTRLNSSHSQISYAVFCLKKKSTRQGHRNDPCPHRHGGGVRRRHAPVD